MATYYIAGGGNDTTGSGTIGNPWLTIQKAINSASAAGGSGHKVVVLPGTWDGPTATYTYTGGTTSNLTIEFSTGGAIRFRIPTGTGVHGMPSNRGQIWKFQSFSGLTLDVLPGADVTFEDYEDATNTYPSHGTEPTADGGQGKYTSAIYFQSCTTPLIKGKLKVAAYNGNGVMFYLCTGPLIEPDASGNSIDFQLCMTGVRIEGGTGARASTTLSATASIGATTITVTSAASFPVNSYINIGTGQGLVSWRRVSAVNGNILTIGEGPYFSFPLEKSHASGSTVRRMGGLVGSLTDYAYIHNLHTPLRNTPTGGNDAGAMCVSYTENCTDLVRARVEMEDAWCDSFDYGVDGGGDDFSNNPADARCWFTEGLIHNVHSPFELGTVVITPGVPNPNNGNCRYSFNVVYGVTDRQSENQNTETAPLMLLRANPYWEIEFNTYRPTNGHLSDGGIQISQGGSYIGTNNNMTIRSNLLEMAYSSPALDIIIGTDPPALVCNYNLIRYITGVTDNAVNRNYGSPADFACTSAGLTSFRSATAWGDNDQWDVNPILVLNGLRPTALQAGSPALNASHKGAGYAIGALLLEAVPSSTYVADSFTRSVTNGWGTASETGGAYTTSGGAATSYNVVATLGTVSSTANGGRECILDVSARDVTGTGRVKVDKIPVGGSAIAYTYVRRSTAGADSYRFKVIFNVGGALLTQISRRTAAGAENNFTAQTTPTAKATYSADEWIRYRYVCNNLTSGVATLQIRLWADGASEPSTWDINTTDSTAGNQISGGFSLFHFVGAVSNGPILYSHDDIQMTSPTSVQTVGPAVNAATVNVYAPTFVKGSVSVSPAKITQTAAVLAPSKINQTATPDRISLSPTTHAPTFAMGTVTVAPGVIANPGAVLSPALTSTLAVAFGLIAQATQVFTPQVNQSVAIPLLAAEVLVYTPIFGQYVSAGLIERQRQLLPLASDTFTRTEGNLGTSSSGHVYTVGTVGSGGGFATTGTEATATLTAPAQQQGAVLLTTSAVGVRTSLRFKTDKIPVNDVVEVFIWARATDVFASGYAGHFLIFPDKVTGNFNRRDSLGNRLPVLTATNVPGAPLWEADTWWRMTFEIFDVNPTILREKIWRESDGEPANWSFQTTDSNGSQIAGSVGLVFRIDTGTTNFPIFFTFDDLTYEEITSNVYAPATSYSVAIPFINHQGVVYGPVFAQVMEPQPISVTATAHAPAVLPTNSVAVALIAASPAVLEPLIGADLTIEIPRITQAAALYDPEVFASLASPMELIESLGVLFDPEFTSTYTTPEFDLITQAVDVYAPIFGFGLAMSLINNTAVLYAAEVGSVGSSGQPPRIANAERSRPPTIVGVGA